MPTFHDPDHAHVSITKLREVHQRTHPARLFRRPDDQPPPASDPGEEEDEGLEWVPVA